jgi:uncharacterized protein (TIGR01440 family)
MDNNFLLDAQNAVEELIKTSELKEGDLLVIGCSTSEIVGNVIGKGSAPDVAVDLVNTIMPILNSHGISLAAQCCEHLNRALIVEKLTAQKLNLETVCVRPVAKAGGSFATAVFEAMQEPVAVEHIKADAGLDIGNTLIGMHLKHVAVPLRLETKQIGKAFVTAAKTRAKFIGGERAQYN